MKIGKSGFKLGAAKSMTKFATIVTATVLTVSLMPACGNKSSNPIKDYNLTGAHPPTEQSTESQDVMPSPFSITPYDLNGMIFTEGQPGIFKLKVHSGQSDVTGAQVEVDKDLSSISDAVVRPSATIPEVFEMVWTPPLNSVDPNGGPKAVNVTFKIKVAQASNLAAWSKEAQSRTYPLLVLKDSGQPQVLSVSGVKEDGSTVLNEGSVIALDFDVKTAHPTSTAPILFPYHLPSVGCKDGSYNFPGEKFISSDYQQSRERGPQTAQREVTPNPDQMRFHYHYVLDGTKPLGVAVGRDCVIDANASEFQACFRYQFQTDNSHSYPKDLCFHYRFTAQKPVFTWEPNAKFEVSAGAPTNVARPTFRVTDPEGKGQVQLPVLSKVAANYPGHPKLDCSPNGPTEQKCSVVWDIDCKAKVKSSYDIAITATNNFGSHSKPNSDVKTFVVKKDESCSTQEKMTDTTQPAVKKKPGVAKRSPNKPASDADATNTPKAQGGTP